MSDDKKPREWFLYESVSEELDTLTAVPRGNDPLDQYANMITVIEKQAYTDALKMIEEMAGALDKVKKSIRSEFGVRTFDDNFLYINEALESYRKFKGEL